MNIEVRSIHLRRCNNPACGRQTPIYTEYCCPMYTRAHELHYEIHEDGPLAHTPGCNERHAFGLTNRENARRFAAHLGAAYLFVDLSIGQEFALTRNGDIYKKVTQTEGLRLDLTEPIGIGDGTAVWIVGRH